MSSVTPAAGEPASHEISLTGGDHSRRTLSHFFEAHAERGTPGDLFEKEAKRVLRIDVDGDVWLQPGAAIAYRGNLRFERLPTLKARSIRSAVLREITPLARATGAGRLYCSRHGWHVEVITLDGETLFVSWEELLAFETSLRFEMHLVPHGVGLFAGGLIVVKLEGHGALGVVVHGEPLCLPVSPVQPLATDPHCTLAWTGGLTPTLKTDLGWRSLFRHGGKEPFQMHFDGTGWVVVQPHEDPSRFKLGLHPLKRIRKLIGV